MKRTKLMILIFLSTLLVACTSQGAVQEEQESIIEPIAEENVTDPLDEKKETMVEGEDEETVEETMNIYPAKIDGRFGYIDVTGEVIIEPKYEWVGSFSNGFARIKQNGKFGFIDESGSIVIDPQFDWIEDFSDGLAMFGTGVSSYDWMEYNMFKMDGGKYGFINTSGEVIIEPIFYSAYPFSEGVAPVKATEDEFVMIDNQVETVPGKWGLINQLGEWIIEPTYEYIMEFSEGLAAFNVDGIWDEAGYFSYPYGGKWGFLNLQGEEVISAQYDFVQSFSEGLAAIQVNNKGNFHDSIWGVINTEGETIIEPKYEDLYSFRDGLAVARQGGPEYIGDEGRLGKWGYINLKEEGIPFQYDWATPFSSERAFVYHGNVVIDTHQPFPDGGGWSIIDLEGNQISSQTFKYTYPFHGDLALVYDGEKWMYINKQAEIVWQE